MAKKDPKKDLQSVADAKELGVTPGIVASGEMFKHGLIWGGIATAAAWSLMAFGRREPNPALHIEGNWVHHAAKFVEKWHGEMKKGIAKAVNWVAQLFGKTEIKAEHSTGSAITATSFLVGGIVGKVVLPGAAMHGAERGRDAVKKYGNLKRENTELKESNTQLMAENQSFRAQLGPKAASFAERVESEPKAETANSR